MLHNSFLSHRHDPIGSHTINETSSSSSAFCLIDQLHNPRRGAGDVPAIVCRNANVPLCRPQLHPVAQRSPPDAVSLLVSPPFHPSRPLQSESIDLQVAKSANPLPLELASSFSSSSFLSSHPSSPPILPHPSFHPSSHLISPLILPLILALFSSFFSSPPPPPPPQQQCPLLPPVREVNVVYRPSATIAAAHPP